MEKDQGPKIMSLESIKDSTNNFSKERKLGSGQFGIVYKGLQKGEEIAVKLLYLTPEQDDRKQFESELEKLWKLHHPNVIRLLGYCYEVRNEFADIGNGRFAFVERNYRVLCFEYMHNGSLQKHLHDEFNGLDWQARYKIIKGTWEGLRYIHEDLGSPIYHLDIKPENILLDMNMLPKLADFGISKLVSNHKTRHTESSIGTRGYMPREYIDHNFVSNKTDIFSLGVVMIRIMTGYEAYFNIADMPSDESIYLVRENWRKRLEATPGCRSVEGECHQVTRCMEIALSCINTDRKQRPEIRQIIDWLNETEQVIEELAMRHSPLSHLDKASNSFAELPNNVEIEAIFAAAQSCQQQPVISVPKELVEQSTEEAHNYELNLVDEIELLSMSENVPSSLLQTTGVPEGPGETGNEIFSNGSSEISKLLDIYPVVLSFPFERNKQIQRLVTLTNRTDHYLGVWITPPSCPDTRPVFSFPASCGDQSLNDGESSYFAETMEPHSSLAVPMTMKELWVLPDPDTYKFEVSMAVMRQKEHLKSLHALFNMDRSEFRKKLELREDMHQATLTSVICDGSDTARCQTTVVDDDRLKFIPCFRDVELTDVHPTETWFLARHKGGFVSAWDYQKTARLMLFQVTKTVPTGRTGGVSREPFSSRLLQQPYMPAANLPPRPHPLLNTPMRRRVPAGVRAEGRWARTRGSRGFRVHQMRNNPRSRIPLRLQADGPKMGSSSYNNGEQQQGGKDVRPDVGIGGGQNPSDGITASSERLSVGGNVGVIGMAERYARPGEATGTGHRNHDVVERMPPSSRSQVRGIRRDGHLSDDRSWTNVVETTNNIESYSVIRSAKFIPRSRALLAIGDDDGWVHIYTYTTTTTMTEATTTTTIITMDKVKEFEAHRGHTVDSLAVHPTDHQFLLTASFTDSSIKLWDWGQGWKRIRTFNVPYEQVHSLTWNLRATNTFVSVSRYDISLLSAQENGISQVSSQNSYISQFWEISNSEPINTLEGMKSAGYLYSYDQQKIMVTTTRKEPISSSQHLQSDNESIFMWDMQREKIVHRLAVCGWDIQDLACHPTLPIFATIHSSSWILCLWDASTYRLEKMVQLKHKHIRGTISIMGTIDKIRHVRVPTAHVQLIVRKN